MPQVPGRGLPGRLLLHAVRNAPRSGGLPPLVSPDQGHRSEASVGAAGERGARHRHRLLLDHAARQQALGDARPPAALERSATLGTRWQSWWLDRARGSSSRRGSPAAASPRATPRRGPGAAQATRAAAQALRPVVARRAVAMPEEAVAARAAVAPAAARARAARAVAARAVRAARPLARVAAQRERLRVAAAAQQAQEPRERTADSPC